MGVSLDHDALPFIDLKVGVSLDHDVLLRFISLLAHVGQHSKQRIT